MQADGLLLGVVYVVKVLRVLVLWVALYVVDKAYQDAYVQRVLVGADPPQDPQARPKGTQAPPNLAWAVPLALLGEGAFCLLLLVVLSLLKARYKHPANTYVIDGDMLALLVADYAATTSALLVLGPLLAVVVQSRRLFRYRDDGLRGIRAYCGLMLVVSALVLALPLYAVLA
jgi:hypothetical protein